MFSLFPFFLFVLCVIRLAAAQASASLCGCNHSMELLLEEEAGIEVDLKIKTHSSGRAKHRGQFRPRHVLT